MRTHPHHPLPSRLGAATLLAGVGLVAGLGVAASAQATPAPLPSPISQPVDQVRQALTAGSGGASVPGLAEGGGKLLTGATTSGTAPSLPPGAGSGTTASESPGSDATGSGTGSLTGAKTAGGAAPSKDGTTGGRATPSRGTANRSSSPAGVQAQTPAASVCLIPTGAGSPAFEVALSALGHDLSSPVVQQFPQLFAPCPKSTVPANPDDVVAVDAVVPDLLGACVRVTRQVAPLKTTLVVLDHDLIAELTKAGVPLDKLVVPCPRGAFAGRQLPAGAHGAGPVAALGPAGAPGAAARAGLPTGLAFTGTAPTPLVLMGATLLALGTVLTRKARLLTGRA
ncbi:hypothetical protein [Pedococcus sp. 5OH_020]|uniref:hypothetical protein n=1 Tax=Pedococcus sp. 5OH_020 TaxID=2989814 RepID=UPI0022E9B420|nr:hypothetical protein [Pedococcus sp. 5OH_020]